MNNFFNIHNHTEDSSIRLLDCLTSPKDLIDKAIEYGLDGICITDHECLSAHPEALIHMEEVREEHPDFVLGLGNEIYLTDTRDNGQRYYHFILVAKDALGHRALRELSSTAWYYSYFDRAMERVPTLKSELEEVVKRFKGHLLATSACLGGELSSCALELAKCENVGDFDTSFVYKEQIRKFINYCLDLFGEDFYIECAPSDKKDQIMANKKLLEIARHYNIKILPATDSHMLSKEERWIHKSFLNSKGGEREVDEFYEFARLMPAGEIRELLKFSDFDDELIDEMFINSLDFKSKITSYSLFHKQSIPSVTVKEYPKNNCSADSKYVTLNKLIESDDIYDRYWVNQCIEGLKRKGLENKEEYWNRLEEEADVKAYIGEKLETNMFKYPVTLQYYIDMMWDCGSSIGASRGSAAAGLNHYLLGVTQIDPLYWNLPFWRYLNKEQAGLGDIDIDLCSTKRPMILQKIKEERKRYFNEDVPEWAKENLGCTLIATFGTLTAKSAIQTACRGYRSEDYPDGLDVDEALYLSSFVPVERGFSWEVREMVYGNPEKNRKPITTFIKEVEKYPGLLDIIMAISGTVSRRGSHASGVLLFEGDPFEKCAFMKTPSGELISQFDLGMCEKMGLTKYDFLITEIQDKIVRTIELLQEEGLVENDLTLRQVYDKYLHPEILPIEDDKYWDTLCKGKVLSCFQFDSPEGEIAIKKIQPRSIIEMSAANGLLRLTSDDKNAERAIDKYVRFKNDISLWYKEMDDWGLTKEEQKILEPYLLKYYGVAPDQETVMLLLLDKNICGFSLLETNKARKVISKKKADQIPALREKILKGAKNERLGSYIWNNVIGPQMSYSFSIIHAIGYSLIGFQTVYLATAFNPIYWNTACLIVDSGSLGEQGQTDYAKIAKAIGNIKSHGIEVGLPDINKSDYSFRPDVENNKILYGLSAMLNVTYDGVKDIVENRPYSSPKEVLLKVNPKRQVMVSLIKGGAFDSMLDRKFCMAWYLYTTCDKKKKLTLQNMPGLIRHNMIPEDDDDLQLALQIYNFNKFLKGRSSGEYYILNDSCIDFLEGLDEEDLIEDLGDGFFGVKQKKWEKSYKLWMDILRKWLREEEEDILNEFNFRIFKEDWDKYALGTISAWEMESLCFYYHEHELAKVNKGLYNIKDFSKLPEQPPVEKTFKRGDTTINMFKLERICGTCIGKNKNKGSISLLTPDGEVVTVKFRKEYFNLFDKQLSDKLDDGKKKVVEKSWFNRGNMLIITGIRSGDDFIAKKYASTPGHQLYKIDKIYEDGRLALRSERYNEEM